MGPVDLMRRLFRAAETVTALGVAWVMVFVLPFRLTARLLGVEHSSGDRAAETPADVANARVLARRVVLFARRLPRTTCLVRALAGWLMMRRRGVRPVIRLGVRTEAGTVYAHAWLMLGQVVLIGGEEADGFQPIADAGRGGGGRDAGL